MKKQHTTLSRRNPFVVAALLRRAGVHRPSRGAQRQADKRDTRAQCEASTRWRSP